MIGLTWILGDWLTTFFLGQEYAGREVLTVAIAIGCINGIYRVRGWPLMLTYRQPLLGTVTACAALLQAPIVWYATRNYELQGLLTSIGSVSGSLALMVGSLTKSSIRRPAAVLIILLGVTVVGIAGYSVESYGVSLKRREANACDTCADNLTPVLAFCVLPA